MHRPYAIATALALGMGLATGVASEFGAEAFNDPPNLYEFAGKTMTIHYSTSSFDGQPRLSFRRRSGRLRQFAGEEIRAERTEIGQLVTVTTREIPDLKTVTLTLLIPDINLDERGPVMFETRVFFTSHHTTIAGKDLVEGPLQTYFAPELIGQASSVEFFADAEPGVFGKVTQSPICPGPQQPGQKCKGPLPDALVELLDGSGSVMASAVTDAQGLFALHALPGEYTVSVDPGGALPHCEPITVTVAELIVPVMIDCDTGIR